jgi:hypothetical protein
MKRRPPKKQLLRVGAVRAPNGAAVTIATHHRDGKHWPTEGVGAAARRRRQAEKREKK